MDAAKQAAIAADKMPDLRAKENDDIKTQLSSLKMIVKDIKADGHCLFRAVEDQLRLTQNDSDSIKVRLTISLFVIFHS